MAHPHTVSPARIPGSSRAGWLIVPVLAAALALWLHGPIAQPAHYHTFVDARAWGPLPNAANVLSNPHRGHFARQERDAGPALPAWRIFAAALVCTSLGSSL